MTADSLFLMFKKVGQMVTKSKPEEKPVEVKPANRIYIFAKNGTNDHGSFSKGDKARGAYSPELVASYVAAGILVPSGG